MADAQTPRTRYRSIVSDSGRWDGFAFRPGDVVISTPPKCGTTWTQMLCALLIFDGPDVPGAARRGVALAGHVHPPARRGDGGARRPDASPLHQDAHAPRRRSTARRRHVSGGRPRSARRRHLVGASRRQPGLRALPGAARRGRRQRGPRRAAGAPRPVRGPGRAVPQLRRRRDARARRRRSPRCCITSTRAGSGGAIRTSPSSTTPTCRPTSRGSCSAWRASSASPAHRNARVSWRRRRAWPGCASARADVAPNASQGVWKDVRAFFRSGGSGEWRERLSAADLAAYEARVAAARRPGSRRLGARRPARVGRRSRTLTTTSHYSPRAWISTGSRRRCGTKRFTRRQGQPMHVPALAGNAGRCQD